MLRFSLHRTIWVGSQITRSEGREDYSEVSYFFKDFSKFVPPATPQKSGPKCAPRVAPCSGCAPGAPPLAMPATQATQAIDHRAHIALTPRSHRVPCHQNVRCRLVPPHRGGPTKSSVPLRPLPDSAGFRNRALRRSLSALSAQSCWRAVCGVGRLVSLVRGGGWAYEFEVVLAQKGGL